MVVLCLVVTLMWICEEASHVYLCLHLDWKSINIFEKDWTENQFCHLQVIRSWYIRAASSSYAKRVITISNKFSQNFCDKKVNYVKCLFRVFSFNKVKV